MKKALIILILFVLFTVLVCKFPIITEYDQHIIMFLQHKLNISDQLAGVLSGKILYLITLCSPIIAFGIYFSIKRLYLHIIVLAASPLIAYIFNLVFKSIIARPRPPIELQIGTHSATCSYVSSHTIILTCLWGMAIFYINKYCENKVIKNIITVFSVLVILLSGFSRILLGVHNPTDVIGAYILSLLFIIIYIAIANFISKRFEK